MIKHCKKSAIVSIIKISWFPDRNAPLFPDSAQKSNLFLSLDDFRESLIRFVTDRKGHDLRYAIDPTKIHGELGWLPTTKFEDGIKKTIDWYLENKPWWENIISGEYRDYYEKMYANR